MKANLDLSTRLISAINLIEKSPILDVGADHGKLSIALALKGFKVYASENKTGPYQILLDNLKQYSHLDIQTCLMDGIKDMPDGIKSVCIIGMGGNTIYKILDEGKNRLDVIEEIIIEPQSSFSLPISYLLDNNFINIGGKMIYERHYYPLLKFVKGKKDRSYTAVEKEFGPILFTKKDPLFLKYLEKEKEKFDRFSLINQNEDFLKRKKIVEDSLVLFKKDI